VEGSCEHGNEFLGSIKCWEVLEWLATCHGGLDSMELFAIFPFF
jgi:hypothetical protein